MSQEPGAGINFLLNAGMIYEDSTENSVTYENTNSCSHIGLYLYLGG
jgi:hypothetical protein